MGASTGIEWTDATWNPVRGCSRVSEGCRHCYAETVAARFSGPGLPYEGLAKRVGGEARWTGKVRVVPEHLADPLRWTKPRRIFVNSMSDLFHEGLEFTQIAAVFGVMAAAQRHTFQVLTKRPRRALEFFEWLSGGPCSSCDLAGDHAAEALMDAGVGMLSPLQSRIGDEVGWPLSNVWFGVSVEDQATADERIPLLLRCPAAVRFVSYEPALGPVDFERHFWRALPASAIPGPAANDGCAEAVERSGLDWVIVGGESGPGARPFDLAWARSTVDRCRAAGVAVFVKQMGRWILGDHAGFGCVQAWLFPDGSAWMPPLIGPARSERPVAAVGFHLTDPKGGDWSEWPAGLRVREFPSVGGAA